MVPVLKKDGTLRLCVDFRRVNAVTDADSFPMPNTEEALAALGSAKVFSTIDLRAAYHQLRVAHEDIAKTAFCTDGGTL